MADLKFVGVNFEGTGLGPVNRVQSQADPSTDRLLIDTIAVSGGVSSPLSVIPLSPVPSSSSALSVSDGSSTVFSVLGDGTLASFGDWINGTNLSYSSGILLDPQGAPTYGVDGSVRILIGSGSNPTVSGTNGSINPPAGSLLLQTNGTAWIKTAAGATSWTQLGSGGGGGSRIEDGDGDTFVDTDLAGGDSDIVTIAAANGVNINTSSPVSGIAPTFIFQGSEALTINSGSGVQAADDINGSNIQIVANDGGLQNVSNGGSGGGVYLYAGAGGNGNLAGQGGPVVLSSGDGGDDGGAGSPAGGGNVDIFSGSAGNDLSGSSVNTGGLITIAAGSGSGSEFLPCGTGGSVIIVAGQGGYGFTSNFVGNGGTVTIEGGAPGTNDGGRTGNGGSVIINGASAASEGNGGNVQISAGNAGGSAGVDGPGTAGEVSIQGGTGAPAVVVSAGTAGGTVSIIGGTGGAGAGSAPPGFGGVVNIRGGDAGNVLSAGAPDGGNVAIVGGFGQGFSGLGGTIAIDGGDANGGAGNYGNVQIGALETTQNIILLAQTDLTFQANGNIAPIPFNDVVDTNLVGFTSTSIIGALNELKASPGITDHGALSGLADDDHTQYILVNGSRAFTGQVLAVAGAPTATPAYSFAGDTGTGFNRPAPGNIGISISGTSRMSISSSLVSADGLFRSASNSSFQGTLGGSGTPTFTFTSDTDTGVYQFTTNTIGFACGGQASYRFADGTLTFRAGQILTTASGGLTLESTGVTVDGLTSDIVFSANSMASPIFLNEPGDTDLDGSFAASSIIGALNELKTGSSDRFTLNAAATITAGQVVIVNGSGTVDLADADNGDQFVAGIALTSNTIGNPVIVQTSGIVGGLSGLTAGTRYYLDTVAGGLTSTAPVGSGDLVIELGFAISATQILLRIQEGIVIP